MRIFRAKSWTNRLKRMKCTKLLKDSMMKNGRSVKMNKKYFLAIFTALGIQAVFGINLANAYCEAEVSEICKHDSDVHSKAECDMKWQTDTDDRVERTLKQSVKEIEQDMEYQKSELNRYLKGNDKNRDFNVSTFKAALCSSNVAIKKLTNK